MSVKGCRCLPRFLLTSVAGAVISATLAVVPPQEAHPQDDVASVTPEDLARVRSRIAREEERYETLKKGLLDIERDAARLRQELDDVSAKKRQMTSSLEDTTVQLDQMALRVAESKRLLESRQDGMKLRIAALYKSQKRTGALDYLFQARSAMDLMKRATYLRRIAEYDRAFTARLEQATAELRSEQQQLEDLRRDRARQVEELTKLEQELSKKRERQAKLLDDARAKTQQQERSLQKLRDEAERLERVIAGLTGGEPLPPLPPPPVEPDAPPAPAVPEPAPVQISREPFNGRGLQGEKGKLTFPVAGEIIRRFGKHKHEEFSDILFLKGVEVRAPVGAQVRAVAEGKVVLSQVLPGYGNVIIIDHGQRYYTLYGRLASSLKGVGQTVRQGEVVAVLGEADYRERNFYFELRVKGKATDPLGYFRAPPRVRQAQPSEEVDAAQVSG